jgi:protein tyrosine/serine phosphatase
MEKYFFEPMLDIYAPLKETEEISNFGIVKENHLYRGGMPYGDKPYEQLKKIGIKTVINLKIEDSALDYVNEERNLKNKGIDIYYLPLPNVAPPTLEQALEFLTVVYDKKNIPSFFHCHRGADRTGVMSAIFRITQGYSASWSLVEAEKYNIASSFFSKKIDFVYKFEEKWLEWKKEGKIPDELYNFNFLSLLEEKSDE